MIVDNFFWCIFASCLRFSALSMLANVRLKPVYKTILDSACPMMRAYFFFDADNSLSLFLFVIKSDTRLKGLLLIVLKFLKFCQETAMPLHYYITKRFDLVPTKSYNVQCIFIPPQQWTKNG